MQSSKFFLMDRILPFVQNDLEMRLLEKKFSQSRRLHLDNRISILEIGEDTDYGSR